MNSGLSAQDYEKAKKILSLMTKQGLVDLVLDQCVEIERLERRLEHTDRIKTSLSQQLMQGMTSRGGVTVPRGFNG
jgi:hypothetical protein